MKFMLSLREKEALEMIHLADERGVTIQELFRAVIFPEWKKTNGNAIPSVKREEK